MIRNQFHSHDNQVLKPTKAMLEIRDSMLKGSGWQKKDGDFPLHFRDKPRGFQVLYSSNWSTSSGLLMPQDWYAFEYMTSQEIIAEGIDLVFRKPTDAVVSTKLSPLITRLKIDQVDDPIFWLTQVKEVLRQLRQGYIDYYCTWDPPPSAGIGMVILPSNRPGWGPPVETPKSESIPLRWTTTKEIIT